MANGVLREDYIDNLKKKSVDVQNGSTFQSKPIVSVPKSTAATTSLNLTTTTFTPPTTPNYRSSNVRDDIASLRSRLSHAPYANHDGESVSDLQTTMSHLTSAHNNDSDLHNELVQSMYSLDLGDRRFVSNEIPSVFQESRILEEEEDTKLTQDKHFFILTSAGKPIYSMNGNDEKVMGLMGIVHTVINYFNLCATPTKLKTLTTSSMNSVVQKFTFVDRSPILLMAMSSRGETENELINQLDFLYSYLISSLSKRQLTRLFNKRDNFDLRNFLGPADFNNLNQICSMICNKFHPDLLLGALECLNLKKSVRRKLHSLMLERTMADGNNTRGKLLYGLIVAPGNRLVSVLRPRGHTLHTTDLHLLFSLIFNQFQHLEDDQELWVPVCFPKFNSSGFLYCYIKFLPHEQQQDRSALVLISAQKDAFFALREIGERIVNQIQERDLLSAINSAKRFTITDIPAPLVHHFIYKSKKHVQYVMPRVEHIGVQEERIVIPDEDDTDSSTQNEREAAYLKKLMTYYLHIHNSAVGDDGTPYNRSTLSFVKWSNEPLNDDEQEPIFQEEKLNMLGLAWLTPSFELYLICNNGVIDRRMVLQSARNIVAWCRKYESRLFVSDGAVF